MKGGNQMKTTHYEITKEFFGGILKGITIKEISSVRFQVGMVANQPIGGSAYRVIAVQEVLA
jgi:hypothetical protein